MLHLALFENQLSKRKYTFSCFNLFNYAYLLSPHASSFCYHRLCLLQIYLCSSKLSCATLR
ncbi:hypothetical protein Hanom_Chr03g00219231 [Helianthus anomalus]